MPRTIPTDKMRTHTFLILSLLITASSSGQTNNISKLFRNLPLDKTALELNDVLKKDTSNYKVIQTKGADFYYYSTLKPDSLFNLLPFTSTISISNYIPEGDSVVVPKIDNLIHLNKRKNSSKKVSRTYNKMVDLFKGEFDHSKSHYYKASRKENGKEYRVDEWTTYFYAKKGDRKPKLWIAWFDEGKYGHQFIIEYKLN